MPLSERVDQIIKELNESLEEQYIEFASKDFPFNDSMGTIRMQIDTTFSQHQERWMILQTLISRCDEIKEHVHQTKVALIEMLEKGGE